MHQLENPLSLLRQLPVHHYSFHKYLCNLYVFFYLFCFQWFFFHFSFVLSVYVYVSTFFHYLRWKLKLQSHRCDVADPSDIYHRWRCSNCKPAWWNCILIISYVFFFFRKRCSPAFLQNSFSSWRRHDIILPTYRSIQFSVERNFLKFFILPII